MSSAEVQAAPGCVKPGPSHRLTNRPQRLTLAVTFAGIFLVMDMRATLFTHMFAASSGKGHAFWEDGTGSALTVGFSNDLIAHGNLPQV